MAHLQIEAYLIGSDWQTESYRLRFTPNEKHFQPKETEMHDEKIAILIIDTWSSSCSMCGKNADPEESHHEMKTMMGEGCGARFVAMGSRYYVGLNRIKSMRSMDLPFISIHAS